VIRIAAGNGIVVSVCRWGGYHNGINEAGDLMALEITREDLLDLQHHAPKTAVLSVYLARGEVDKSALRYGQSALNAGLRELQQRYPDDRQLAAAAERTRRIYRKLPREDRQRNLVLFLSLDPEWLWWRTLQISPGNRFVWMDRPYLRPLVGLLDAAPPVGVIAAAQGIVRLLTWTQGIIEEAAARKFALADRDWRRYVGPAPSHPGVSRQTSTDVDKYGDRVAVHVRRFLQDVGAEAVHVGEQARWERIVVLAAPDLEQAITGVLPEPWTSRVLPAPAVNMSRATPVQIADAVTSAINAWVRTRDERAVYELLDLVAAGGSATASPQEVFDLLAEGRVSHLYLDDGLRVRGYRRPDGGYVIEGAPTQDDWQPEPHLIERLIEMSLDRGVPVTVLQGPPAERLGAVGGLGAHLRY
jgi:hypothetical protein